MASIKERLDELHAKQKEIEAAIAQCYQESLQAPEAEKVVPDWAAEICAKPLRHIEYPVQVHGISRLNGPKPHYARNYSVMTPVAVRPCDESLKGKTFFGVYLGEFPREVIVSLNTKNGVLTVCQGMHNPAMWVPELDRVVWGCESWWGAVESEKDLPQITDDDIQNTWYVKAMQAAFGKKEKSDGD